MAIRYEWVCSTLVDVTLSGMKLLCDYGDSRLGPAFPCLFARGLYGGSTARALAPLLGLVLQDLVNLVLRGLEGLCLFRCCLARLFPPGLGGLRDQVRAPLVEVLGGLVALAPRSLVALATVLDALSPHSLVAFAPIRVALCALAPLVALFGRLQWLHFDHHCVKR